VADNSKQLKDIVAWKSEVVERFNTVKIKAVFIEGVKEGKIVSQGLVNVRVLLFQGKCILKKLKLS